MLKRASLFFALLGAAACEPPTPRTRAFYSAEERQATLPADAAPATDAGAWTERGVVRLTEGPCPSARSSGSIAAITCINLTGHAVRLEELADETCAELPSAAPNFVPGIEQSACSVDLGKPYVAKDNNVDPPATLFRFRATAADAVLVIR